MCGGQKFDAVIAKDFMGVTVALVGPLLPSVEQPSNFLESTAEGNNNSITRALKSISSAKSHNKERSSQQIKMDLCHNDQLLSKNEKSRELGGKS